MHTCALQVRPLIVFHRRAFEDQYAITKMLKKGRKLKLVLREDGAAEST
jgi:hypothetical protein